VTGTIPVPDSLYESDQIHSPKTLCRETAKEKRASVSMLKPKESKAETQGEPESEALEHYRESLILAEEKAQSEYDRLIVTLSGGALAVSFAFVHQFIGNRTPIWISTLIGAWTCWVVSLACILISHYFSATAMRKAIEQVDVGAIRTQHIGGWFDAAIKWSNILAGLFFLIGAILTIVFVVINMG